MKGMASIRSPRFARVDDALPEAFVATDRHLAILRWLFEHRVLSSDLIADLDGGSPQQVLRTLRTMYDAGLVDRPKAQIALLIQRGNAPLLYCLGRAGARLLAERDGLDVSRIDWTQKNQRLGSVFLEHQLGIARFRVALERAVRTRSDIALIKRHELVARFPEATRALRQPLKVDAAVRLAISSPRTEILANVPDDIFALSIPDSGRTAHFPVEIDTGSMKVTPRRGISPNETSVLRKLAVFWHAWRQERFATLWGIPQQRILFVTTSQKRIATMLEAVRHPLVCDGRGSDMFVFGTFADIAASGPLAAVWTTGKGEPVSLLE
ncbi:MAG: replication-relaxation family protein [Vicinamibacterales bacterium]